MVTGRRRVYVFDASAFIEGLEGLAFEDQVFTTPEVVEELREAEVKGRSELARELGRVRVESPRLKHVEEAERAAFQTGDFSRLSKADLSLLALAVQLRAEGLSPTIVSGDYAVQNVAEQLNLNYASTLRIKHRIRWLTYCSSCGRSFPPGFRLECCPTCGGRLKRKPLERGKAGGGGKRLGN